MWEREDFTGAHEDLSLFLYEWNGTSLHNETTIYPNRCARTDAGCDQMFNFINSAKLSVTEWTSVLLWLYLYMTKS